VAGDQDVSGGFGWVLDPSVVMFCLTCVRAMPAGVLLSQAGADASGSLEADAAAVESMALDRQALGVRAAPVGDWSVLIEFQSLTGADPQWVTSLSPGREVVSVYQTGAGMGGFLYAQDGTLLTMFEPALAATRSGAQPDRLLEQMRAVSIDPDGEDTGVDPGPAALELVARITGVRLSDEVVRVSSWPAGFLPHRRRR
jgi:hypothetical protein